MKKRIEEYQELFNKAHCINQCVRLAMQAEMQMGASIRFEVATIAEKRILELIDQLGMSKG